MDDAISRIEAALEAGPTPGPWHHEEWGSKILDSGVGSSQLLIAQVAVNTFRDQGRHNADYIAAANPSALRAIIEHVGRLERQLAEAQKDASEHQRHIYRLREQIARDTDTIYTLRGLLSLARDALADCLDDAPTSDQLSVSGGVYEGVAVKAAIRAIDAALERTT